MPAERPSAAPAITAIPRDECLRLLAADEVGRLAFVSGSGAAIVPVNYALDGEAVVMRTDPGAKLRYGPRARASFEIDRFDPATRSGWSVVATGRLEEVTQYDSTTWARIRALGVEPWAGGEKASWLRLVPDRITGRRVGPAGQGPNDDSSSGASASRTRSSSERPTATP